jgi:hypothetical protein
MDIHGNLSACDHGVTFHQDDKLRTVIWQYAGSPFNDEEILLLENARNLSKEALFELISPAEIDALNLRIERLLKSLTFPRPSQDWPAIPWPPF